MSRPSDSWDAFMFARCVIAGNNRRANAIGAQADQQILRDTLVTLLAHILAERFPTKRAQLDWLENVAVFIQLDQQDNPHETGP